MFTLLPAPQIEGLQVLHRRTGKWIRLVAPPGTKPRDPALRRSARASFPLNAYLWEDEVIEVLPNLADPKYRP